MGTGSGVGAASAIRVSLCWQTGPDYWTDVFHLALSVDTSCLHCMRGQHYTGWDTSVKLELTFFSVLMCVVPQSPNIHIDMRNNVYIWMLERECECPPLWCSPLPGSFTHTWPLHHFCCFTQRYAHDELQCFTFPHIRRGLCPQNRTPWPLDVQIIIIFYVGPDHNRSH